MSTGTSGEIPGGKPTVLIVDDNILLCDALRHALRHLEPTLNVEIAGTAEEAGDTLDRARRIGHHVLLVALDGRFPRGRLDEGRFPPTMPAAQVVSRMLDAYERALENEGPTRQPVQRVYIGTAPIEETGLTGFMEVHPTDCDFIDTLRTLAHNPQD